jgi:hypothetical protein
MMFAGNKSLLSFAAMGEKEPELVKTDEKEDDELKNPQSEPYNSLELIWQLHV